MADKFLGAWLVTEYVFAPAGHYLGHIRQRRELLQLESGAIRVIQHCQPDDSLADHLMGRFTGEWVFDLTVAGRQRLYHGPAVIGSGRTWGEGVMFGSGLWPEFGHNFDSFSILATPERQLTGGKFYSANEMVANIVGVAVPEADGTTWPELDLLAATSDGDWSGHESTTLADGSQSEDAIWGRTTSSMESREWLIGGDEPQISLRWQKEDDRLKVSGVGPAGHPLQGLAKQYGPMRESILYGRTGNAVEQMDIYDSHQNKAVTLRRWRKNHAVDRVQAIRWQRNEKFLRFT